MVASNSGSRGGGGRHADMLELARICFNQARRAPNSEA
jgi:hypothetical protein